MIKVYLSGRKRRYFSSWALTVFVSSIKHKLLHDLCILSAWYPDGAEQRFERLFHWNPFHHRSVLWNLCERFVSFTSGLSNFLLVPVFDYVHVRNCLESVMERNVTERNTEQWVSALPRFTTFLGNLNTKFYVIVIIIVKICMCDWFNYVTQSDQFSLIQRAHKRRLRQSYSSKTNVNLTNRNGNKIYHSVN